MKKIVSLIAAVVISGSLAATSQAKGVQFNMLASTPIGSWQIRENVDTNHKGKQTGSTIKTSLLSSEMRDGEKHYWVEMVMDTYKISKKGKRKKQGDQAVIKSLVPASLMNGDPANVMGNLRGFGKETIIQSGKGDPTRISGSGGFLGGMMKSMGIEIKFDFNTVGSESINVPAGDFSSEKIQGTGTADGKILFKKFHIESDTSVWMSKKVPFGTIKILSTSVHNGKKSRSDSELLDFGLSGAKSLITKEPKDMPQMPNIFGK
jgi:hypothetical protein